MNIQQARVYNYLKTGKSISSLGAITRWGITRLSARIYELTLQGYEFNRIRKNVKNRYGENASFIVYSLKK